MRVQPYDLKLGGISLFNLIILYLMVKLITASMKVTLKPFWFPEAVLILVSTKKNDLWEGLTPEVLDSRTSRHSSRHSAHAQGQV